MAKAFLLVNLGTPSSPEPEDVKSYLQEFLMDEHVLDVTWWKRWALVNLIIAPFRSKKSAKAYQKVWLKEGSPLMVYSQALKKKVAESLSGEMTVDLAMRYGEPALPARLDALAAQGMTEIYVLPLYPQYADSSTGTAIDAVEQWKAEQEIEGGEDLPEIHCLREFPTFEPLIESFARNYQKAVGDKVMDHTLISFHSLPERHLVKEFAGCRDCLDQGECPSIHPERPTCYRAQAFETARALAKRLELKNWSVSFQSKLTREPWLTPATNQVIPALAQKGVKSLAVICPSFVSDCLGTLEEIAIEAKDQFLGLGGQEFHAISCPNDDDHFAEGLAELARGWKKGSAPFTEIII